MENGPTEIKPEWEKVESALESFINRKMKADKVGELRDREEFGDIILGGEQAKIRNELGYEPFEVAGFILEVRSDPNNRIKFLTLQRVVELLPSGHPLHSMIAEIKNQNPQIEFDKRR